MPKLASTEEDSEYRPKVATSNFSVESLYFLPMLASTEEDSEYFTFYPCYF
jgi:hypothetical protein